MTATLVTMGVSVLFVTIMWVRLWHRDTVEKNVQAALANQRHDHVSLIEHFAAAKALDGDQCTAGALRALARVIWHGPLIHDTEAFRNGSRAKEARGEEGFGNG